MEVTKQILSRNPNVDVVYSTFQVIDEHGSLVEKDNLSPSIKEILDSHDIDPLEGEDVWIDMVTKTGYTNLTSSTSVRTNLALQYPFPNERVSEDYYSWIMYSAGGGYYHYTPLIPCSYRIPQNSASRTRARIDNYYNLKANVDELSVLTAIKVAKERNKDKFSLGYYNRILVDFYTNLSNTLMKEGQLDIAVNQLRKIEKIINS